MSAPRSRHQAEETVRPDGCKSVYIGNLPFSVTEHDLKSLFQDCGEIDNARCVVDKDTGRSRGYGYVDFIHEASVDRAIAKNGIEIEGRALRIDFGKPRTSTTAPRAERGGRVGAAPRSDAPPSERPEGCKSIYVGNLAFSVTDDALKSIFQDCGGIESARCVTDRETGRSRGYGYVDFADESALNAAIAKNGLEVGGRPIRVDFSKGKSTAPSAPRTSRGGRGGFSSRAN